jgi:hypothetical protein
MNLESFEATQINVCGQGADRTNKIRTDRSLMFGAGGVDRVVSFMYRLRHIRIRAGIME